MGNEQSTIVQDFRYQSGNVYSGGMKGSKRSGQGVLTWPDGASYNGMWLDDHCEGAGTMRFPNGSVFEGNFVKNNPHGEGKLTTANGEVINGFWEFMGRADRSSTPVGKYNFRGEILDLKTGKRTLYNGPLAFYLVSGLVSLPNMPDPAESMLPFAIALADGASNPASGDKKDLAEDGRLLFQEGMNQGNALPVANVVQNAATSSVSVSYGQPEQAFENRHPEDHATYSLLDPRLYLASLGLPVGPPANVNQRRQDAIREQQQSVPLATAVPAGRNNPAMF